ncbi:Tc toxin subunit A [Photorhabdus sp. CRCIA-P01]|uniref:Tc toxin subunit A-related protein n=1 Tax=Photorhabdus sp. CRCIA-P01 TaxID=2019570 RepID=UPI0018E5055A|nr:Tc toxin subunit A [Photorhabdus sp. CRCIA-P01]
MSAITKDFARFPFDGDTRKVLISLGFSSIYDILSLEATRFYQQYDPLLNGNAIAIYQQAKDFVTLADQHLRSSEGAAQSLSPAVPFSSDTTTSNAPVFYSASGAHAPLAEKPDAQQKAQLARYRQPLYERLFFDDQTRFAPPGSLQSLDSPVSYLMYLLTLLCRMRRQDNSALKTLLARRPDLSTLLLSDDTFKRALPTSELAAEILQNALKTLTRQPDIDRWLAFCPWPLSLPFDVADTRIDLVLDEASLTRGDAWSTLTKHYRQYDDKSAAALAWSKLSAGLQEQLTRPLNNNAGAQEYPQLFLLIDQQGQPADEHLLTLAQLWPGRNITDLQVTPPETIQCYTTSTPLQSIKLKLAFATHRGSPDSCSLQKATIDGHANDNQIYRATAQLTVQAKSEGKALEPRHLLVGILVGRNVTSRRAALDAFDAEQKQLTSVLGAEIGSVTAANMAIPVDMLCQAAGINRQQLQDAFASGESAPVLSPWISWDKEHLPINGGIYGARFLWGTGAWLAGRQPGNIQEEELSTTPFQLDRLQKLIRLQQVSGLPYGQLDSLLQNAIGAEKNAPDITAGTLRALGVYQRYHQAHKLDAEQVAALFGPMPYAATAGKTSLLDRLLTAGNTPLAGSEKLPTLPLAGADKFSAADFTLLATAFNTTVDTLNMLIATYKDQADYTVTRSLEGITALYRPLLLAKAFAVSADTLLLMIEQICQPVYKESLALLAQPVITPTADKRDSIDLLITLDEAVRWGRQHTRDLSAFIAPLQGNPEKTKTFQDAFIGLWQASGLNKKPGEAISDLKKATSEQQKASAGQPLAPLVTLMSQQFHLEPGVAWSLLFNYATLLDPLVNDSTANLKPLLLAASVLSNAHLDEVALTPWRNGKLSIDTTLPLWQQLLLLHDFIDLATGDERLRPVLLSAARDWQARLAKGEETDINTVSAILGEHYTLAAHHRLQRMAAFARASGWGVSDLLWFISQNHLDRQNWNEYFAFSLRGGNKAESDSSALVARLGEKRNRALLTAYKSQCRRLTIADEDKHQENSWQEHEPTTADVADRLLIDPEITAKVPTTRIAEATASVQAYLQSIADGRDPQWYMTKGELKNWHDNDRYYAIWAANQQLRWHPDQYINPLSRQKKTPPFRELENRLSQARLDRDSINDALSAYLTQFEQVVNLSTIGAYQDGMSSTQSTIYFLGRSPHAPFSYYYRRWGKDDSGLRLWSSWQKITLPTTQNVLTQAPPGAEWNNYRNTMKDRSWMPLQARLLIFAGRVSFLWVETRTLTQSTPSADKKSTVAEKMYQHVISLVYQRINGDWSTPIELYKGQPVARQTLANTSYIDPLPHLTAFVLPREIAETNLKSIKQVSKEDPSLAFTNQTVDSDLLVVALHSTYSDPEQTNANSKVWLFDEDLTELLPMPRWEKLSAQAKYEGMDINAVKDIRDNKSSKLLTTMTEIVNNAYLNTPAYTPSKLEQRGLYHTRVLTPCIPENWLFNQRRLESRSERIFGTQLALELKVSDKDVSQAGRGGYRTDSVLTLTTEQWQHLPSDAKLVHFLSVKGRTVRQVLTSPQSTLSLFTLYPDPYLDSGETRHGVVMVAKSASDIVSTLPADNAWIESGQLTVLHKPLTELAAEIRENQQGTQYLTINDIAPSDPLNTQGQIIHGRIDAEIHQTTTTIAGVYSALIIDDKNIANIKPAPLQQQDAWMPVTLVKGQNGEGLSQWNYDIPIDQVKKSSAVWLVTKVDNKSISKALSERTTLPEGVAAAQISQQGALVQLETPKKIVATEPVYLFTAIPVTDAAQQFSHTCQTAIQTRPVFSPVAFKFYLVHKTQEENKLTTLQNAGLRIISQQELDEDLQDLSRTTLFTSADWGWITPTFLTSKQPYQLNRSYRLQSPGCHYLLLKVATSAIDTAKSKTFSISVQTMLNLSSTAGGHIIALNQSSHQAEEIPLSNKHIASSPQSNKLALVNDNELKSWLDSYSHLFFALPWTANAMADVADYGLRFQLDGLKNDTSLYGLIPCEIPTLSDAAIVSRCTPGHAAVGDTVTLQADIKLGSKTDQPVNIEVALNAAYQWAPGMAVPAGAQIKDNGTLTLTLPRGQRTVSLTLPVRVLNAIGNILPLATLTIADNYSARRVMLEQPLIEHAHSPAIEWDWYFGGDTSVLNRSSALRAITSSQLRSKVVLTVLQIAPPSSQTPLSASLKLPAGINIAANATTLLTALEKTRQDEPGWLDGIKLVRAFLETNKPAKTDLLKLLDNVRLTQPVLLPLPLALATESQFTDSLQAEVQYGPATTDVWRKRSEPMLPDAKDSQNTLAISASSSQQQVVDDPKVKKEISGYLGDNVQLTLLIEALKETTVSEISLALPAKLSWQNGAIQGVRLLPQGSTTDAPASLKATEIKETGLKIAQQIKLKQGERYQLDVTLVAIPHKDENDPGQAVFSVKPAAGSEVKANALTMRHLYPRCSVSIVAVKKDGTEIPAGTPLTVGSSFDYRIAFTMNIETLQHQLDEAVNNATPGPRLRFTLPSSVSVDKKSELSTNLPLLSKEQAEQTKATPETTISEQDYGLYISGKSTVYAQTVINPHSNISGELLIPVNVDKEGSLIPTLTVAINNDQLKSTPKKAALNNQSYYAPPLSAYDSGRLPFTDLQFQRSGREGFDLPRPENVPPVLANQRAEPAPGATRYVRLNTQFGQALVRTARYNPLAVLRAAMQDHPLPPIAQGEAPQPLEQDIAHQLYFWELFYHAPALIACKLNQDGRYEEAQEWLHHLFHPVFTDKEQSLSSVWQCRLLTTSYSYVSLDQATGPVDPDIIASVRPEFYRRATFFAYVKNLLDSGDSDYRRQSRDGFNKAYQSYLKVAHLLGAGEQPSRIPAWKPLTVETAIHSLTSSGTPDALFALPRSHVYQHLVDKLQQRLFNLRNGLTLDGSPMSLPLYDPPLDPAQLLAARAQGGTAGSRPMYTPQNLPLPVFRYSTLYARANAAADTLIQFGASLLSHLSAQKDQQYQSLLINQQKEMSNFVIGQQQLALQMNQQARQSMIIARDAAQQKLRELDSYIEKDISDQESQALSLRSEASILGISSAEMRATGAALDLAPNVFGLADGGMHWGAIPQAIGEGLVAAASSKDGDALQIETREMYRHRRDEWKQQRADTEASLQQLNVQLEVDTRQQENLERQLAQSQAQIGQFEQQLAFISTRFTNELLYQWLVGQLSSLYYQVYDVAAGLCQQTLTAWQYEVGNYSDDGSQFFKNSGWNDAQRGLLSGEHLRLGLLQMDKAYLSQTQQMLEIRHTVSLKSVWLQQNAGPIKEAGDRAARATTDASQKAAASRAEREKAVEEQWKKAVQQAAGNPGLKVESSKTDLTITIPVTEDLLAQRYPGHYQRQVLAVSVTLPCLVGPHEEVCAILTQQDNFFAIDPAVTHQQMQDGKALAKKILTSNRLQQAIALSGGLEDNGVVLNFNDDKYRPFESNGVVGTWCLTIPNPKGELQQRMLTSLNDIILTFHYRAKDGGKERAGKILQELNKPT